MLILQKDYITIDLEKPLKTNFTDGGSQSTNTNKAKLHFTVQCNGKIKRHTTSFYIKEYSEPMGVGQEKSTTFIMPETYHSIQEAISMLNSLGYEIDYNEISKGIDKQLNN